MEVFWLIGPSNMRAKSFPLKLLKGRRVHAGPARGGAEVQVRVVPLALRSKSILCLAVGWDTVGHPCSRRCCLATGRAVCFSIALKAGSGAGVWQVWRGDRVKNPPKML